MQIVDVYQATRAQLLDTAASADASAPVPATPGWTVKDVYAHLSGVCADMLSGNLDGAGSPEWTANHVAARADRSLADVCQEWRQNADAIDAWIAERGPSASFMGNDIWSHQQDVRGALGLERQPCDERSATLVTAGVPFIDKRVTDAGLGPLRIVTNTVDTTIGVDGTDAPTLRTDDRELLRIVFGRRTLAQMQAAGWDRDPGGEALELLHMFPCPAVPLVD